MTGKVNVVLDDELRLPLMKLKLEFDDCDMPPMESPLMLMLRGGSAFLAPLTLISSSTACPISVVVSDRIASAVASAARVKCGSAKKTTAASAARVTNLKSEI